MNLLNNTSVVAYIPFSSVDYPGEFTSVLFFAGCNFDCKFCYNQQLLHNIPDRRISIGYILEHLKSSKIMLDAVTLSGGDPFLQPVDWLESFMKEVKALGYKVGVHTNGSFSYHVHKLQPLVDWFGIDYKITPDKFSQLVRRSDNLCKTWISNWEDSVKFIKDSSSKLEIRTTLSADFHDEQTLVNMAKHLNSLGITRWYWQPEMNKESLTIWFDDLFRKNILDSFGVKTIIRGVEGEK